MGAEREEPGTADAAAQGRAEGSAPWPAAVEWADDRPSYTYGTGNCAARRTYAPRSLAVLLLPVSSRPDTTSG